MQGSWCRSRRARVGSRCRWGFREQAAFQDEILADSGLCPGGYGRSQPAVTLIARADWLTPMSVTVPLDPLITKGANRSG